MATDSLREIAEQIAEPCVFWCGEQDYTKEGYADSIVEAFTKALERAMRLAIEATKDCHDYYGFKTDEIIAHRIEQLLKVDK